MSRAKQDRIHGHLAMTGLINLSAALPLAAPLTLMVDPSGHCNFRCTFCPTGNHDLLREVGRTAGYMSLNLFEKLMDDLGDFPAPPKTLLLYLDGEPLMNKNIAKMVAYAKDSWPTMRVEITTNAALLRPKLADGLLAVGLDHLRVSVEAVDGVGYREITKTYHDLSAIVGHVRRFRLERDITKSRCTIHAKIPDTGLSDDDKALFRATWAPIADTVNIDSLFAWSERPETALGQAPTTAMDGVTPRREISCCPSPFKTLAIKWDGRAVACCADWANHTTIGDANTQSLPQIWDGEPLRALRLLHLRGERHKNRACASCDYVRGTPAESDLSGHEARLLPMYA